MCFSVGEQGPVTDRLCSNIYVGTRYNVALLYLTQANYDLDIAVENYLADEKWERSHPMKVKMKGAESRNTTKQRLGFSNSITGQPS